MFLKNLRSETFSIRIDILNETKNFQTPSKFRNKSFQNYL